MVRAIIQPITACAMKKPNVGHAHPCAAATDVAASIGPEQKGCWRVYRCETRANRAERMIRTRRPRYPARVPNNRRIDVRVVMIVPSATWVAGPSFCNFPVGGAAGLCEGDCIGQPPLGT